MFRASYHFSKITPKLLKNRPHIRYLIIILIFKIHKEFSSFHFNLINFIIKNSKRPIGHIPLSYQSTDTFKSSLIYQLAIIWKWTIEIIKLILLNFLTSFKPILKVFQIGFKSVGIIVCLLIVLSQILFCYSV